MTSLAIMGALLVSIYLLAHLTALRDKYMILWKQEGLPRWMAKEHFFSACLQGLQAFTFVLLFYLADYSMVRTLDGYSALQMLIYCLLALSFFWIMFDLVLNKIRKQPTFHLGTNVFDNLLYLVSMAITSWLFPKTPENDKNTHNLVAFIIKVFIFICIICLNLIIQ